jgi:predicted nucleotidyltransferase
LNEEYVDLIKEYLEKVRNSVTGVILFGSVARKEELPFPKSDIDLIVVTKQALPKDLFERAVVVRKIEDSSSSIQSTWFTEEEFTQQLFKVKSGFVLDAIHDGIVIYDGQGFLKKIIPEAKRRLREQGIKRVGRAWVWPIKTAGEVMEL